MRALISAVLVTLALAGCAPSAAQIARDQDRAATNAQVVDRALAQLTPGASQSCLNDIDRRNARTQIVGSTILYRVRRNSVVRNDMGGNCNLSGDPILVTATPSTSLCRGDIVQLVDRTSRIPVGSCAYGDFVPYTKAR
jgi:hypothetical protein